MCGRYSLYTHISHPEDFEERFGLPAGELPPFPAGYNIGPYRDVPVIFQTPGEGMRMRLMQWQLVPAFAKEFKSQYAMFNSRAETITSKPFWQRLLQNARCIFPANNFFEWAAVEGQKVPHKFYVPEQRLLAFGGLYSVWRHPESGEVRYSASIITVPANPLVAAVHPRMPLILPREIEQNWLDPAERSFERLQQWLQSFPGNDMGDVEVSPRLNNIKNDDSSLIEPLAS